MPSLIELRAPSGVPILMLDRPDAVPHYVRHLAKFGRTIDPASVSVHSISGGR